MWCLRRLAFDGEDYPPGVGGPSVGTNTHSDFATATYNDTAHIAQPSSILAHAPILSSNLDEVIYSHSVYSNLYTAPTSFSDFSALFGTHNTGIDYDPVAVEGIWQYGAEVNLGANGHWHPSYASSISAPFPLEHAENGGYAFKSI